MAPPPPEKRNREAGEKGLTLLAACGAGVIRLHALGKALEQVVCVAFAAFGPWWIVQDSHVKQMLVGVRHSLRG